MARKQLIIPMKNYITVCIYKSQQKYVYILITNIAMRQANISNA